MEKVYSKKEPAFEKLPLKILGAMASASRFTSWNYFFKYSFMFDENDSALLSGEELNSCSHYEKNLGNFSSAGDFSLPSFLLVFQKKADKLKCQHFID